MGTGIQLLVNQALECGEGPVYEPASGRLFWTDSGTEALFCYDEHTGQWEAFSAGTPTAALALHAEGGLVLAGRDGFFHRQPDGSLRSIATETADGQPIRMVNEVITDPVGRLFGGQEAYREDAPYQPGFLYRVDLDGKTTVVEEGLHNSNGMGFSPDQSRFYLIDSIPGLIYEYEYAVETGTIRNRRVLVRVDRNDGLPDGMTVDAAGFLWVARWFGGGLTRYDPDGKPERTIALPVAQPTSVAFGGPDWTDLYVTSAAARWESPLAPQGHDYCQPRGGNLYRIKGDIGGRPEFLARV